MSDWQRRARETLTGRHRPNAGRRDSERNLQAHSGVGDEWSRKFGKSARWRFRFHTAILLAFGWLCKRGKRARLRRKSYERAVRSPPVGHLVRGRVCCLTDAL